MEIRLLEINMLVINYFFGLSRFAKRLISILLDSLFVFLSYWIAWVVRIDSSDVFLSNSNWFLFFVTLPLTLIVFVKLGLYKAVLRYLGTKVIFSVLSGIIFSVFTLIMTAFFTGFELPRTVPLIYAAFLIILVGGSRLSVRAFSNQSSKINKKRVIIYGSGPSGRQLAQALMHGKEFDPVAFIDDDKNLQKTYIHGRPVYDFNHSLQVIEDIDVKLILLAMPNLNKKERSEILLKLEPLTVEVKSIPSMSELVSGESKIDELSEVAIEDLLGRDPVEPDLSLMNANIANKVVMVTGAGGSIGSELCRQIIAYKPKILILFEQSEFALYSIEAELSKLILRSTFDIEVKPIIGSVQNQNRVEFILNTLSVQTIYHAAAYKHVPLVEYNVIEGVLNNVFGTYSCAKAAAKAEVESFVLISTDKAVRPTNIMGASKRLAELCLQALSKTSICTTFSMVRFGNVLGSSGSVVPLFKEQIKRGGPITVTHKEITRYFMTIPEASQLVIQAAAMAKGGDVFVLDMGDAVKISDLAIKMVHLMGLEIKNDENVHGDIELKFSGLRPGEKLYEELLIGENVIATKHERIMSANEEYLSYEELTNLLTPLKEACLNGDVNAVQKILLSASTGYSPDGTLNDLLWLEHLKLCNQPLH